MPGNYVPITLRVEPGAIAAVRAAVQDGLAELTPRLFRLGTDGYIPEAWLGDPISASLQSHYNTTVMDSPDGPYAALRAYEAELIKIRDNLQLLEDNYRRTEGDNAALWGRV
jgi:hypothetical protein